MVSKTRIARRRFLSATLALGAVLRFPASAQAAGSTHSSGLCQLSAEQEVGPYYIEDELLRSNITEGRTGVPLLLNIALVDARRCLPLANAIVDIWHCDALGIYSGFTKTKQSALPPGPMPTGAFGPPPGAGDLHGQLSPPPPQGKPTDRLTFLRGVQRSDAHGNVVFQTIFPGFYPGRTNHIHFKVRVAGSAGDGSLKGEHVSHVGQIFFPEKLTVLLMQDRPYRDHRIQRTALADDEVFLDQQGAASIARFQALDSSAASNGLRAQIIAAVDPESEPVAAQRSVGAFHG
ncbi:intradiol ring-cleavage dioxygenase [Caballeronia sp. SEWSISQ10-4 2]|uniref:intradiol ring-cleavage dioxygenase n=1 Tax=Caballeronia sp. SEWSISQ10-4 2 TaxID=2937438 RepID=UPI0026501F5A|nr:intradiol ring-cleavage dioxygenase [Caballeronia sp. SEWSISQ10-4 2]MDN7180502.1 intradiol ring-cleavage dioxygenase [Caballeronia sp. SEWSISQ10-4 2]